MSPSSSRPNVLFSLRYSLYSSCGQYQQIQFNWHDDGDSSESEGSSSGATSSSSSGCSPHCIGLDGGPLDGGGRSSGTTLVNSSGSSSASTLYGGVPPHLDYMAGREQLQEFPGKIPQRKRKSRAAKAKKPPVSDGLLIKILGSLRLPDQ